MRILIATLGELGHITPFLGVARRLADLGHTVGWLTQPTLPPSTPGAPPDRMRAAIEAAGAIVLEPDENGYSFDFDPSGGDAHMMRTDRGPFIHNWMRFFVSVPLSEVAELVDRVRHGIRAFQPQVGIVDSIVWIFLMAFDRENIPYIGAPTNLEYLLPPELVEPIGAWSFDLELLPRWREMRSLVFAQHGMNPGFGVHSAMSRWRDITFTTAEFIGDSGRTPCTTELVGPGLLPGWAVDHTREHAFEWHRLDPARKLVLVAFGSRVYWQPERLRLIARAAQDLPVQLVIACSELARTDFPASLPGDPIVVPWVPQRKLLERAHAFVTHCGANSMAEAHWAGVPMLAMPIDIDQPIQAHFIDRSGAGIWLRHPERETAVAACRRALAALIDDDSSYRARAAAIMRSYHQSQSATRVAEIAIDLAGSAAPGAP